MIYFFLMNVMFKFEHGYFPNQPQNMLAKIYKCTFSYQVNFLKDRIITKGVFHKNNYLVDLSKTF